MQFSMPQDWSSLAVVYKPRTTLTEMLMASSHPQPRLMRYVVVDIVDFTKQPGQKQPRLIGILEQVVKEQTARFGDDVTYLQAGDSVCVVFSVSAGADAHIRTAMAIHIQMIQPNLQNRADWINLCIGVGQGEDYEFTDINGRKNFAGAGLNNAFRACQCCEPGEIFVTADALRSLRQLELWASVSSAFRLVKTSFAKASKTELTFYRFEGVINWANLDWNRQGGSNV